MTRICSPAIMLAALGHFFSWVETQSKWGDMCLYYRYHMDHIGTIMVHGPRAIIGNAQYRFCMWKVFLGLEEQGRLANMSCHHLWSLPIKYFWRGCNKNVFCALCRNKYMFIVQFCTFLYSPIPDNRNCDVHLHNTQFIFGRYTLIMVSYIDTL